MKQRQRMPIRLTDRPARDFRRAGTGTASRSPMQHVQAVMRDKNLSFCILP